MGVCVKDLAEIHLDGWNNFRSLLFSSHLPLLYLPTFMFFLETNILFYFISFGKDLQ